jgi:hypothetical protein
MRSRQGTSDPEVLPPAALPAWVVRPPLDAGSGPVAVRRWPALLVIVVYMVTSLVYGAMSEAPWDDDCVTRYFNTLRGVERTGAILQHVEPAVVHAALRPHRLDRQNRDAGGDGGHRRPGRLAVVPHAGKTRCAAAVDGAAAVLFPNLLLLRITQLPHRAAGGRVDLCGPVCLGTSALRLVRFGRRAAASGAPGAIGGAAPVGLGIGGTTPVAALALAGASDPFARRGAAPW